MTISLHPDTPQGRTLAAPAIAPAAPAAASSRGKIRSRLFTKYVALFVAVVGIALLSNGIFEVFFYYREHKAALIRIQHEQAEAAAAKISQFIKEIESQLGWTTQLPWSAGSIEQRRFDALRLLRQVPAITELAQVDSTGKERLRVSRLAMDVVDSGLDLSKDPKFTEAVAHKVYYGPDLGESFQRAAALVDRIFKGADPADLPFEQPTRYLFVVNLKTARAADLEMPPTLLALADEVIE